MRGVDAPALRTCSGESQENCSGASCSTLSAACSDAADCSGVVSWSIAPSSCANFVSPTMGTPYFRAFCALPLMESGLAATSSAHFFVTSPTSRPAAVARWVHLSRGMSIAPVSAMDIPRLEGELGGGGAGLWFAERRLHEREVHAVGPGLDGELAHELLVDRLNIVGAKPGGDGGVLQLVYLGAVAVSEPRACVDTG